MKNILIILFSSVAFTSVNAQYRFTGHVDTERWEGPVYLSLVEDYRKLEGVYQDQIIAKAVLDSSGYFTFTGNELHAQNRYYRLHVDDCSSPSNPRGHLNGKCGDTRTILFIANNSDTINFPVSFDDQTFCEVISTNEKSRTLVKIDSLEEVMEFAHTEISSSANRKLNEARWFNSFQTYGLKADEPLTELYAYQKLSNRSSETYTHYLEDFRNNDYYENLLVRLEQHYPKSPYTLQYEKDLEADKVITSKTTTDRSSWILYALTIVTLLSLLLNIILYRKIKHASNEVEDPFEKLTPQESKILGFILDDKSNKEIAEAQYISVSTVKTHVNSIFRKLEVNSRQEAKSLAQQR